MATELECPVDFIMVNENKVRLTALHVLLLAVIYLFVPNYIIAVFLTADFFLRGFNFGKYSLLSIISDKELKWLDINVKPIDQAPKRFAVKIGFIFSTTVLLLMIAQYTTAAIIFAGILIVFAFLESFAGFCAGCYVYTFYIKLFGVPKK